LEFKGVLERISFGKQNKLTNYNDLSTPPCVTCSFTVPGKAPPKIVALVKDSLIV